MRDVQPHHRCTVERIAEQAYAAIAAAFPVCAASDEFYYFPQVVSEEKNWRAWDNFSAARVEVFAGRLLGWERELGALDCAGNSAEAIDASLLQTALRTLREQLVDLAPQSSQPTFHLTVIAAGLSETLAADCSAAWADRIAGLPRFLQRAIDCLDTVPRLFLDLGRVMAADLRRWLLQLQADGFAVGAVPEALELFIASLAEVPVRDRFAMSATQFERLVCEHLRIGLDVETIRRQLESERAEMEDVLCREAALLAPGRAWRDMGDRIPFVAAPGGDLLALYHPELKRLEDHVRRSGLAPPELPVGLVPDVSEVADTLAAIRAADAYAARPGYPPRGGTFYVFSRGEKRGGTVGRSLEYRMTAAHETWPGHHLLDVCRWNQPRPVRRPIERPLFYEGWACLAEELMARSGYFDGAWDRFLLARRRIERAVRGLVDLGLQSGRLELSAAAELLVEVGYPRQRAEAVVPKYALRPGYQVCYSLGLRQYLDLLDRFGQADCVAFTRTLLRQGQIDVHVMAAMLVAEGVG